MNHFKIVFFITLLCVSIILETEAKGLFESDIRTVKNKSANWAAYCSYDGQIFYQRLDKRFSQSGSLTCRDSYTYSFDLKYTVITLSQFNVNCNGFNDIEIWEVNSDNTRGRDWIYCRDGRPSSVTFVANGKRWVGISRLGAVGVTARFSFPTTNPIGSTTTISPTIAPATSPAPNTGSCGVQAIKPDETGLRIVGGRIVIQNSWPWQVGFKSYGSFFCGGSLINDQWILTAAHCATGLNGLNVHLGDHDILTNGGETRIGASKWINHPSYNDNSMDNDIALVKLNSKVTFSSSISPVCLPQGKSPVIGTTGVVTGWGVTQADGSGPISTLLKQVVVPINDHTVCGYGPLPAIKICAGNVDPAAPGDSCQGDSGGPFVLKDKTTNAYYVAGVVSYGELCGGRGVYASVKEYETWIANTIAAN